MIIPLHGYFDGDFLGLVVVADTGQSVSDLADQFSEWVLDLRVESTGEPVSVHNEAGDLLDPASTLEEAGLSAGDRVDFYQGVTR